MAIYDLRAGGKELRCLAQSWFQPILIILTCFMLGCASHRQPALRRIAQSIKIGMSKVEVRANLGEPVGATMNRDFYGPRIEYKEWESPYTPTQLTIYYLNDTVEDVSYFEGFEKGKWFYRASEKGEFRK